MIEPNEEQFEFAQRLEQVQYGARRPYLLAERDAARDVKLKQVALEAIRLVACKGSPCEPCDKCGVPGLGPMKDALKAAFGVGYSTLIWGEDGNVDSEAFDAALEKARG